MQKTAYEMRISDWSSDVCSSDLLKNVAAIGALSLEDGRGVVERVGQHMDVGLAPGHQLAVEPDPPVAVVIAALVRHFGPDSPCGKSVGGIRLTARSVNLRCRALPRPFRGRSEERRVGKECASSCRARGS